MNANKPKETKKWLKFGLVMLACMVIGGLVGVGIAMVTKGESWDPAAFMTRIAPATVYVILGLFAVMTVAVAVYGLPKMKKLEQEVKNVDPEDFDRQDQLNVELEKQTEWTGHVMPVCFILEAVMVFAFLRCEDGSAIAFLVSNALFMVCLWLSFVIQKKAIDLVKALNPEKKGSLLDMNFSKQWSDSCDEAEKIAIGRSAYQAYNVASKMCVLLWVVTVLMMFLLGTDALAPVCVCILWIVMRVAFIKEARNPKN